MTRLHTLSRSLAFAALVALAPLASAQDDATKSAAEAQKQLGDIQKGLAGGTDLQKRLRVDKFEAGDEQVKVTGVFLDAPAAKADDPVPFDAMQDEVGKLVRDRLKDDKLKFDWSGVKKIDVKDHPHVVLQLAANAAGAKGDTAADRCLFAGSRFGADGGVVISGKRGKDADAAKWLAGAISTHLAKHAAVKVVSEKPLVTDDVKPVEWKLAPPDMQKLFASSTDAPTRRLRVDRVYMAYDAENPDPNTVHLTLAGVRLGEDAVDTEALPEVCRKQWPELFTGVPKVLVDLKPLLGPGIPEPAAKLQAAVAVKPSLDGVRIDPGAEFGASGELMLAGLQPGLTPAAEKELIATYQAVVKEFIDKADATAPRYKKLAEGGVSTKQMKPVPTVKLLAELREWTANTMDDARLSRLYYAADGGLKLQVKTVTKADGDKVRAKFKELAAKYLPADAPKPPEPPKKDDTRAPDAGTVFINAALQPPKLPEPATVPATFSAGFTAHLRKEMAGDQKKWNGVLIERGLFDEQGRYTLRGVVDTAAQNDELVKLFDELKTDPKWAEFFTPAPNKPVLEVVPLRDLLDRVKRVAPAYPEFDGIRIESAQYDSDVNLIFKAHVAGELAPEPAALLAKLLRDHPAYKRRAPSDKQVKIVRVSGPADTDAQEGRFSLAYGAKLLEGTDAKKAKAWLDSALLHYPNESGVWFLSAYFNYTNGDTELVRRDLYRMIELEGPIEFNGTAQRKRRYEAAKNIQGKVRNELESLWLDYFREVKDGAKRMTMTKEK